MSAGVSVAGGSPRWVRRGLLAVVLVGAAFIPGHAFSSASHNCTGRCGGAGTIRWVRPLPGSWTAAGGMAGTVPSVGAAYAAAGSRVAAIGFGLTVDAFQASSGAPLWIAPVTGFPAGASIVAVRAWPDYVTVGVSFPRVAGGATVRSEVIFSARTGRQLRRYPAAAYGGAVAAGAVSTVVVGPASVTSYSNGTGQALWSRPTGKVPQAWRVDQGQLYFTVAAGGYLGTAPVTALRRISLKTGAERTVRPPGGSFAGTLSGAFDGVVLFSGSRGLAAYSGATGQLLWQLMGTLPEDVDAQRGILYVVSRGAVTGVDPQTGLRIARMSAPSSSDLYAIRGGIALGLDLGALGEAWGYEIASRRVIWTTPLLPWPHYFVDLSGIGGSADPRSGTVLLSSCAALGSAPAGGTGSAGPPCTRPELVAVNR
jgi:outer membrane protein assembly factor BamB